jgi:acyl-CoA hydrolase
MKPKAPLKPTVSYRKLVMHEDLNPAGRLFGGRLLQWVDEAAAMYAMCQLMSRRVVTLKFTESIFKEPVFLNDMLEFMCSVEKFGKTSLTINVSVERKDLGIDDMPLQVFTTQVVFVAIDEEGRPTPHYRTKPRSA